MIIGADRAVIAGLIIVCGRLVVLALRLDDAIAAELDLAAFVATVLRDRDERAARILAGAGAVGGGAVLTIEICRIDSGCRRRTAIVVPDELREEVEEAREEAARLRIRLQEIGFMRNYLVGT